MWLSDVMFKNTLRDVKSYLPTHGGCSERRVVGNSPAPEVVNLPLFKVKHSSLCAAKRAKQRPVIRVSGAIEKLSPPDERDPALKKKKRKKKERCMSHSNENVTLAPRLEAKAQPTCLLIRGGNTKRARRGSAEGRKRRVWIYIGPLLSAQIEKVINMHEFGFRQWRPLMVWLRVPLSLERNRLKITVCQCLPPCA